jgi:hypothetical protein
VDSPVSALEDDDAASASLERFSFPYSEAIPAVTNVVRAFRGREKFEGDAD